MSVNLLRALDRWWVLDERGTTASRIDVPFTTTRELLEHRAQLDAAVSAALARPDGRVDVGSLPLETPVTAPCRVVAQMTNFVTHVRDSGMDPETVPLTFFRKASGSISGPHDDILKPAHVRFLDYEVEIGLVMGTPVPVGTTITDENWADYVAGIVITNDVSARDVQLPQTQFYEAKSYPTFTPTGPVLVLLDRAELARFDTLRLTLTVNGEVRQDSDVSDMVYKPVAALRSLAQFQHLDPGDLVLTGTPGGTALKAPPKIVEKIASLMPADRKWKALFRSQAKNTRYLQDGDVVEAAVFSPDRRIDAGVQRTTVRYLG